MEDNSEHDPLERETSFILLAIFFTLAWSFLFFYYRLTIYWKASSGSDPPSLWKFVILPTVVYVLLHPVIGKIWYVIVEGLCRVINYTYGLRGYHSWGGWNRGQAILFASLWPITGPVGFVITFIGSLFGLLFKALFR
jgi:hypothetical protein